MKENEVIRLLCEKLWGLDDPDCHEAELYGFKENIINLFADCYDYEGFCKWLASHDCNPAWGFREAELYDRSDFETEEDFLDARADSLFYNDDYLCMRW